MALLEAQSQLCHNMLQWALCGKMFTWKSSRFINQHSYRVVSAAAFHHEPPYQTVLIKPVTALCRQWTDLQTGFFVSLLFLFYLCLSSSELLSSNSMVVSMFRLSTGLALSERSDTCQKANLYIRFHTIAYFIYLNKVLSPHPSIVYLLVPGSIRPFFWLS